MPSITAAAAVALGSPIGLYSGLRELSMLHCALDVAFHAYHARVNLLVLCKNQFTHDVSDARFRCEMDGLHAHLTTWFCKVESRSPHNGSFEQRLVHEADVTDKIFTCFVGDIPSGCEVAILTSWLTRLPEPQGGSTVTLSIPLPAHSEETDVMSTAPLREQWISETYSPSLNSYVAQFTCPIRSLEGYPQPIIIPWTTIADLQGPMAPLIEDIHLYHALLSAIRPRPGPGPPNSPVLAPETSLDEEVPLVGLSPPPARLQRMVEDHPDPHADAHHNSENVRISDWSSGYISLDHVRNEP
ncbi:hypothetical protein FN846DRAFT_217796 [Sphaerosporella brunnea]|uniref:Uncharacterized protein n=1 Tax=Sphaerosporella brunnea TaxID=1250544 RepID=A0A5J5F738_9PEZI|nr:hypothetical protein FN846DRAFT_217796 [Sphaerosporella brunnea]